MATTEPRLKTYQYVLQTVKFQPWLYLLNAFSMLVIVLSWNVPPLVIREFFNLLAEKNPSVDRMWLLVGVIFVTMAIRLGGFWSIIRSNQPFMMLNNTLYHKNILSRIFQRPG